MSLLDKVSNSLGGVVIGIGAVIAAPFITKAVRPLAKEMIKGGFYLTEKAKEYVAESGEELADLVAEARSEMNEKAKAETTGNGSSS